MFKETRKKIKKIRNITKNYIMVERDYLIVFN